MPSGSTHDRITLWSLPVVTGLTVALTRSGNLTLLVSGGFLFSGLMLSPDLDLRSRPFKRWGWLRWIWIPYQKAMHHRSVFSHGPIVGTTLRVLYLGSWIVVLGMLGLIVVQLFRDFTWSWEQFVRDVAPRLLQRIQHLLITYRAECIALFVGLELGAMSHSLSDSINSAYKRSKKKPKRKPTNRKRTSSRRSSNK
ncbi:MAG TPA: metal-binding protein [Coleofasciculaceae cyanobacterium]